MLPTQASIFTENGVNTHSGGREPGSATDELYDPEQVP